MFGGWSEYKISEDEECKENKTLGKWTKPAKRYCNDPEPLYGGICDGEIKFIAMS